MTWFFDLRREFSKRVVIAAFLLCALPSGLVMALLTPLSQTPDSAAHMARAEGLLHGAILAVRKPAVQADGAPLLYTGVKVNGDLFAAAFGLESQIAGRPVETQADRDTTAAIRWDGGSIFTEIPNTGTYFPTFYVPATIGLAAGMAAGLSPYNTVFVARIFMLAAFLALGAAALWVAAYGEALLLTALLLPMTLFLAGSLNPDGVAIATACLAAAALTRNMALFSRPYLLAVALIVVLVMAKLPYAPLLGLILLPLTQLWRRLRVAALAFVPVLSWAVLLAIFTIAPFGKTGYHPGPLYAGNHGLMLYQTYPAANLRILLSKPALLFSLPYNYLVTGGIQKIRETIGVLGALSLRFPNPFYYAWIVAFGVALLGGAVTARPPENVAAPGFARHGFVLFLLVVTFWALAISMYLNWTNVGAAAIDGLQGRYYIPLLPFLVFAVPVWRRFAVLPAVVPALPAIALGVFDLGYLPQQMVNFFYLH